MSLSSPTVVMVRDDNASAPRNGWYVFQYKNDEGYITRSVMVDQVTFDEMGKPTEITVTITPVNTLEVPDAT